ncbi:MAG TPA: hypothetical protein DEP72_07885 [Clostridiales bacterium]|nr:hypothetical protein [Clostridiales bacterium]
MLCQFTVKNYRSIKESLTLDMQATSISDHTDDIITGTDGEKFLPLAVIYGPNGSGKSTVLEAIANLLMKVMRPICAVCEKDCSEKLKKIPTVPFKFAKDTLNSPTEFEIYFRVNNTEYNYNLNVKSDIVVYESLYKRSINSKRKSTIFIRNIKNDKNIELSGTLKKLSVSEVTDTLPLLSYLAITNKKNSTIKEVISWIEEGINMVDYGNPHFEAKIPISSSKKIKDLILTMIKEMDIGIEDYRVDDKNENKVKLFTKHIVNNKEFELDLIEESSGTFKLFGIMPRVAKSLIDGQTLLIDELDAKIHPKLLKYIISLYRSKDSNSNGAQLIFTSHDLYTMNSELFRRDEIWFIAKNIEQASKIYSLVEFKDEDGKKVRNDARYEKQYLEGRYGADPYLRKIINWGDFFDETRQ